MLSNIKKIFIKIQKKNVITKINEFLSKKNFYIKKIY